MVRPIVESPHTNPADALELARKAGTAGGLELFEGKKVISDGGQTLELHAVTGIPHVEPKVLAFVPKGGVLFQSDLFFPGTGAPAGPDAVALLQAVKSLKLRASKSWPTSSSPSSTAWPMSASTTSGKLAAISSPVRENSEAPLRPSTSCTRIPSHFHSAAKSLGSSLSKSLSSTGLDSISGWNRAVWSMAGRSARPSSHAKSSS